MRIMVAYDGTSQSKEALRYGIQKVSELGGELIAMQVLDPLLFLDYSVSALDAARSEAARIREEAKALLRAEAAGIRASVVWTEGDPEAMLVSYAEDRFIDVLLCPPRYRFVALRGGRSSGRVEGLFYQCPVARLAAA